MTSARRHIAILGGTGDLGSGLAYQFAKAGHRVVIGSRTSDKAAARAAELNERLGGPTLEGGANAEAAAMAEVIVMTVPFANHAATIETIREQAQGKVFIDTTVPLVPPKVMRVQLPASGSVAKRAQELLGEKVRVVSAFQNIAAHHLRDDALADIACDILVCGNDADARSVAIGLAEDIGLTAWHAGSIDNSVVAEALTSVLIFLNKKYQLDGAGIRVTSKRSG